MRNALGLQCGLDRPREAPYPVVRWPTQRMPRVQRARIGAGIDAISICLSCLEERGIKILSPIFRTLTPDGASAP